jgi:hypothetical protein
MRVKPSASVFPEFGNSRAMGELKKFDGIGSRYAQVNVVAAALF